MAAENGGAAPALADRLYAEAYAFDFFQAVRLLEKMAPERRPVGQDGPPAVEVAHFRAHTALNFPASELYQLDPATPQAPVPIMTVTFMGLTGPLGALPRVYTEMLMRTRDIRGLERFVARDWLDLFNHRFVSLFYRTWTKYRFWMCYERGEHAQPDPDLFTESVYSLIGLGGRSLKNRLRVAVRQGESGAAPEQVLTRVEDLVLLFYAGLLAHRPRCALSLERLLQDYFDVPVRVLQFQGQWLRLDPENQTQISANGEGSGLGVNVIVGDRVWDIRSKIRICLGPLSYERFASFLPDQSPTPQRKDFFKLMHLVRLYVGPAIKADVQLILRASDIPKFNMHHTPSKGPRLGWNTWLTSRPVRQDSEDAVFDGVEVTWTTETDGKPQSNGKAARPAPRPAPQEHGARA
jgi:type VI secretion system protein ImpH